MLSKHLSASLAPSNVPLSPTLIPVAQLDLPPHTWRVLFRSGVLVHIATATW